MIDLIVFFNNQYKLEKDSLNPEQQKYVENTIIGYEMLGLGLPDEQYERVKEINKQLLQAISLKHEEAHGSNLSAHYSQYPPHPHMAAYPPYSPHYPPQPHPVYYPPP